MNVFPSMVSMTVTFLRLWQSQFCASFYLVAGGGTLFYNGIVIGTFSDSIAEFDAGRFTLTEFLGCLAGVTFVVSITAMIAIYI